MANSLSLTWLVSKFSTNAFLLDRWQGSTGRSTPDRGPRHRELRSYTTRPWTGARGSGCFRPDRRTPTVCRHEKSGCNEPRFSDRKSPWFLPRGWTCRPPWCSWGPCRRRWSSGARRSRCFSCRQCWWPCCGSCSRFEWCRPSCTWWTNRAVKPVSDHRRLSGRPQVPRCKPSGRWRSETFQPEISFHIFNPHFHERFCRIVTNVHDCVCVSLWGCSNYTWH